MDLFDYFNKSQIFYFKNFIFKLILMNKNSFKLEINQYSNKQCKKKYKMIWIGNLLNSILYNKQGMFSNN